MDYYYVNMNAQDNGDHEVHKGTCHRLPLPQNRIYLGMYDNCRDAVNAALLYYATADGCYYCCEECHTS